MKTLISNEFKGWKKLEVFWLVLACAIITGLSIYWKDSLMGIISATTGVACVVCTGKGKLSAYVFGVVNCVLYAVISYNARLYGETMLNALYYVPMQFVGFYVWSKNMNNETYEVKKIHMKNSARIFWLLMMVLGTIGYGYILKVLGDAMPFVEMYSEQWWIWIAVDIFSVYMWWTNFSVGNDNMATLLMWVVYLMNAIIMCYRWEKEVKATKKV